MKKVRITVMRKACYEDLMAKYENPIEDACTVEEGQVFIADGWRRPEGLCESAWGRRFLRRLDEESALGDDLVQRWLPPSELLAGNIGRRS